MLTKQGKTKKKKPVKPEAVNSVLFFLTNNVSFIFMQQLHSKSSNKKEITFIEHTTIVRSDVKCCACYIFEAQEFAFLIDRQENNSERLN